MKDRTHSILNTYKYGGLTKSMLNQIKPLVRDANYRNYKIITPLVAAAFIAIFISYIAMGMLSGYVITEVIVMTIFIIASILFNFVITAQSSLLNPLIYILNGSLFVFAIIIGIFQNPTNYSVTFMVLLVALPLITIEEPYKMEIIISAALVVFIIGSILYKDPSILKIEIANAVCFWIMSSFLNMKMTSFRLKSYFMRYERVENNWIDPLTKVKNYYAYSRFMSDLNEKIENGTAGKFAIAVCDINGMKVINDSEGHEAGNEYLVKNCRAICRVFKHSPVYRIGGDSFLIYITDKDYEKRNELYEQCLSENAQDAFGVRSAARINYAIGLAEYNPLEKMDYKALYETAENSMLQCKQIMKGENSEENRHFNAAIYKEHALSNRKTVLIINGADDVIDMALQGRFNVIKALDVPEAIEILKNKCEEIAIVIFNAIGEGVSCNDFLAVKKNDLIINSIPTVVVATKNVDEEKCFLLGAKDFIRKPVSASILISRVENLISFRESSAVLSAIEYDSLTGLYTKEAFLHYANQRIKEDPSEKYSILISDIDDFKAINENYGTEIGDQVLKETAKFILEGAKYGIIAGRYGNDQFVSLIPYVPELKDAVLEQTHSKLINNSMFKSIKVNAKYGIYDDIDTSLDISILCDRAMLALNTIKHKYGKLYARYDDEIKKAQELHFQIEQGMQDAYDKDQFKVYYQPKHDARTGKMIGAEALVRWEHPTLGFLPPNSFISQFEKNGFITYADYYVWKRTCMNLGRWQREGKNIIPISVNASKKDFEYENYLEMVKIPLKEAEINPKYLHIEVTESLFMDDVESMRNRLKECRDAGFMIELDDFGSGYSTLNTLGLLPIDVLKLDMDFLKESEDKQKAKVLAATINLAHELGLKITAEGVETGEQLNKLQKLECDIVQGYYYSRPLPEEEFERYLEENLK